MRPMTPTVTSRGLGWALSGILRNRCPRCAKTPIFRRLVLMQPVCSTCGYVYERENGYFLGAMVIGYFLGAFSTVPTLVIGIMILKASLWASVFTACLQIVVIAPLLFRFSRLAWIFLDYRVDPQGPPV